MSSVPDSVAPEFPQAAGTPSALTDLAALAHGDLRMQEVAAIVGKAIDLVFYHLRQLRGQEIVHERRSSAGARDVYCSMM